MRVIIKTGIKKVQDRVRQALVRQGIPYQTETHYIPDFQYIFEAGAIPKLRDNSDMTIEIQSDRELSFLN